MRVGKLRRTVQTTAVAAALGLLVAACGGGSSKKPSAATPATVTSEVTSSTDAVTSTTAVGDSTTTTTAASITTTTAKKSSSSVTKRTTVTTAGQGVKNVTGGLRTVVAPSTTAPGKEVQPGGTLTFLKPSEMNGFDPVIVTNSGNSDGGPSYAVFDVLLYTDPSTGNVVAQTAQSLTSTDALVWTLKLRPNIKFSDGTPYDASAVKFNWARLQDPALHANRAAQAQLIQTMDVVDAQTLKLTLKSKNAVFPIAVSLIPFIGSPTAIQKQGDGFSSAPVGAGPYTLKSWVRDSQMVFVRNPTYWDAPRPYIDQIIMKPIIDETQRLNTFVAGQAGLSIITTPQNAKQVADTSPSSVAYPMILNGGINIYFNTKKAPFNDVRARQAIAMALDFTDYSKVVNSGLIEPIDSVFRHDSPFYDPAIRQPAYDPVKAQQLFDQLAADHGGPLQFTMTTFPSQSYLTAAQYVQGIINRYKNVKIDLAQEASALHISNCTPGNFASACVFGNIFDDPEPTWTGLYTCTANPSPTGWCNTQFDNAVADNQQTLDPNQRIADMKAAQRAFYAEVPSLYIERRYSWEYAIPALQDFHFADDGMPLFGLMWLKTH